MKRVVRLICLLMVAVIIMTMPVFAAESGTPRASYFFARHATYLTKISDTQFQVWFDVGAVGMMDELGTSKIIVERSSDGVNWTGMKTYTKDVYTQMIDDDTVSYSWYVSYTGTKGYYYRAYVTFYAKNDEGFAETTDYTETLYLPKT